MSERAGRGKFPGGAPSLPRLALSWGCGMTVSELLASWLFLLVTVAPVSFPLALLGCLIPFVLFYSGVPMAPESIRDVLITEMIILDVAGLVYNVTARPLRQHKEG